MNDSSANILVIDDDLDILRVLVDLLGYHGYRARATGSGRQGVVAAQADPPDLILLDMGMPGVDGFGVLQALQADSRTRAIPVLFVSGRDASTFKSISMEGGAVDYVTKPFDTGELLARIRVHLRLACIRKAECEQMRETLVGTVRNLIGDSSSGESAPALAAALARAVAEDLNLPEPWEIELAALLWGPSGESGACAGAVLERILAQPGLEGVRRLLGNLQHSAAQEGENVDDRAEVLRQAGRLTGLLARGMSLEEATGSLAEEGHPEVRCSLAEVARRHLADVA